MENPRVSRVLRGDMRDLPPMNSQIVRIFTSSTFTDTMQERNFLIENVYPKIQQYCRSKYGLEFQVVDMRWGVRDEATDDHQTMSLCMQEIQNCQQLSAGPNFVAFIGQRHGYRPFPPTIESAEFRLLLQELETTDTDGAILTEWFQEDLNVSPPVHVLQPISSKIPGFLSEDPEDKSKARRDWNAAFGRMQILLRQAVTSAYDKGKIDSDVKDKYFMSVTEKEIEKGVFKSPGDPNSQCLCFVRVIEDILSHLSHDKAWRFIDMLGTKIDEEAQTKLTELRDEKMTKAVKNLHRLKVLWKDVCNGPNDDKKNYLNMFSNTYYKALINMIDKGISFNQKLSEDSIYMEVLQHQHMAKERCELFHGRQNVLDEVKSGVLKTGNKPVLVVGSSGCGKTSVISKCAMLISEWHASNANAVVILRLLGTTPASTGVQQLMKSLCDQIALCYGVKDFIASDDTSTLIREFHELLENASAEQPLYILLDSLDQLSPKSNAFKLTWLPRELPSNVTLLMSTLPDRHGILETLQKRYSTGTFVTLTQLGEETSKDILNSWLVSKNRKLTKEQLGVVQKVFRDCSLALYVKLMTDRVLTWSSYLDVSNIQLPKTIRESINQLFDQLKHELGTTFVMHALGYLTASKSGLSETEIEDLLSLDDVVLTDVFQYHVPPVRRIPQLLWLRLKSEIASYLVNREAEGTRVIFWYHRQFIEAAKEYFLGNAAHCTYLHKMMVEYFSGIWYGTEKEFKYNEYQMKRLGLDSPDSKADRKVSPQPLVFEIRDEDLGDFKATKQVNIRKLVNLPFHIHHSGPGVECDMLLRTDCLYNYEFLKTKVEACSAQSVMYDFDLLHHTDECDSWLRNIFRMRKTTLNKEPLTLPVEVAGTLLPVSTVKPYLKELVDNCYNMGVQYNALLPRRLCYQMPGGSLVHEIEHPLLPAKEKMMVLTKGPVVLAALTQYTNTLVLWDIEEGDVIEEVKLWPENEPKFNVLAVSTSGDKIVCGCAYHSDENPIAIYDVAAGELIVSTKLAKTYPKIGFIDSYEVGLMDDKIYINVKGREADCFDFQGNHLYTFNVQAREMHLHHQVGEQLQEIAFTLKDDIEIVWFSASEKKTLGSTLTMAQVPYKMAYHENGNDVFVIYKDDSNIHWFQRQQAENGQDTWDLKATIDLNDEFSFYTLGSPNNISVCGPYLILFAESGLSLWKYSKKRLFNEFKIPDEVKPKDEKVTSCEAQVTSDRRLLLCAYDRYIIVWDLLHGRLQQTLKAMTVPISKFLIGQCGGELFPSDVIITATSRHRSIKVWDSSQADSRTHEPLMMNAACRHANIAENSNRMILRSHDVYETRVVDLGKGCTISLPAHDLESKEPILSPDGQYAVLSDFQSVPGVRIFNADDGSLIQKLSIETIYLKRYSISQTSKYIATHAEISATEGVETNVWDIKTGKRIKKIKAVQGGISKLVFANNDKVLVTLQMFPFIQYDENAVMHIYSVRSGKEVFTIPNILKDTSLLVVPNTVFVQTVIAASNDKPQRVVLIDVMNGKEHLSYEVPVSTRWVHNISHNGKTAVDAQYHIVDVFSGKVLYDLSYDIPAPIPYALTPRISPDSRFVVWTVHQEAVVKVARIKDQKLIGTCYTHGQPVSLAISKDNIVACCTYEGIIMLLSIIDVDENDSVLQVKTLKDFIDSKEGPMWGNIPNSQPAKKNKSSFCTIT